MSAARALQLSVLKNSSNKVLYSFHFKEGSVDDETHTRTVPILKQYRPAFALTCAGLVPFIGEVEALDSAQEQPSRLYFALVRNALVGDAIATSSNFKFFAMALSLDKNMKCMRYLATVARESKVLALVGVSARPFSKYVHSPWYLSLHPLELRQLGTKC